MNDTYEKIQEEMVELLEEPTPKLKFSMAELNTLKKIQLVALCDKYNLTHYGNKPELIERLLEVEESDEVVVLEAKSTIVAVQEKENENGDNDENIARGERI